MRPGRDGAHDFRAFAQIGSAITLVRALGADGVRNKRGRLIDKALVYQLLANRIYLDEAVHKGTPYPGEHAAVIDQTLWDKVHAAMRVNLRSRR